MAQIEQEQDIILARLKASRIPNVFEVSVPDDFVLPKENGVFLPYAIVSFGGQSPVANRNQNITSSRDDLKWTSVAVEVVAATPRSVRYVVAEVRDLLEGYSPSPNWGELSETLNGDYTVNVPDIDLWPVRHATGIVFNTMTNAERPN